MQQERASATIPEPIAQRRRSSRLYFIPRGSWLTINDSLTAGKPRTSAQCHLVLVPAVWNEVRRRLCSLASCVFILMQRRRNRLVHVDGIVAEEMCSFKLIRSGYCPQRCGARSALVPVKSCRVRLLLYATITSYALEDTVILNNWNGRNVVKMEHGTNEWYWN